jgi:shikimate dehydrogenase
MSLRFVLFGHPVSHSMSPLIHAAAYRELGLPHRYELFDAPDEAAFVAGVAAVRARQIAGANVTVPYKRVAMTLADRLDESAARVGAANVLHRAPDGAVVAYNTDVPALAEELQIQPNPRAVLVLGSGGGALAAVCAARKLGARDVAVTARRWVETAPPHAWEMAEDFRQLGATPIRWPEDPAAPPRDFEAFCRKADIVLQATSAGMRGAAPGETLAERVPWAALPDTALAYDLVYNPPETAFLRAARARGLTASNGLGMLVTQAVLAIELWLGVRPSRPALYAVAEAELAARGSR